MDFFYHVFLLWRLRHKSLAIGCPFLNGLVCCAVQIIGDTAFWLGHSWGVLNAIFVLIWQWFAKDIE